MPSDKAHDTIASLIGGLVAMMKPDHLPAVDFADLRTMFSRDENGNPTIWYVGIGSAAGEGRAAEAAKSAAADLTEQTRLDPPA